MLAERTLEVRIERQNSCNISWMLISLQVLLILPLPHYKVALFFFIFVATCYIFSMAFLKQNSCAKSCLLIVCSALHQTVHGFVSPSYRGRTAHKAWGGAFLPLLPPLTVTRVTLCRCSLIISRHCESLLWLSLCWHKLVHLAMTQSSVNNPALSTYHRDPQGL